MKSTVYFKFEDLLMYQKAIDFGESVYRQIKQFPSQEKFRLSSQFIRAADSIANNIAEGSGDTNAQFNRYLQIAWDSAHECVVCSTKAYLRKYIDVNQNEKNRKVIQELSKMITSYKKYLRKKNKH